MSRYRRLFDLRLGGRARARAELDQEIDAHIEMRVADLVRRGMSVTEARMEAQHRFGDFDDARRRLRTGAQRRDATLRQRDTIGAFIADLRYAFRQSRRAPGFTALAVASLAIGIGATTAMFTLVDHILLRPLPFPHAEQLLELTSLDSMHRTITTVSSADWLDWRRAKTLRASALYSPGVRQPIVVGDSAIRVDADQVSSGFFTTLGTRFVVGRSFNDADLSQGTPVVVISEHLWRSLYGADPQLRTPLRTASRSYTIVGVVASGQEYPAGTDAWYPVDFARSHEPNRTYVNWYLVARRQPSATPAQVDAELSAIARGIRAADPTALYDYGVRGVSLAEALVGYASSYLTLLMGAVVMVLLIVCVNVAASALARSGARSREMAVRTSLGAGRGRLMQQLLVEHLWLAGLGGAIGLFVAWVAVRAAIGAWGNSIPRADEVVVDARAFAFAAGMSVIAGVLAGIAPAVGISRVSLRDTLASGGRTAVKGGRNLAGASLVSGEIALAVLLLTGSGLLIRSFRALLGRGLGFDTNVATASVSLNGPLYATDTARIYQYWDALTASFQSIPGVQAAGLAQWSPLGMAGQGFVDAPGHAGDGPGAVYRVVNSEYFQALEMPLIAGRVFGDQDRLGAPRVAVVNRLMANSYWPGESPIGKLVRARSMEAGVAPGGAPWLTVIGVVGDIRTYGLESDARPEMYVYYKQVPSWVRTMTVLVRGSGRAESYLPEMRRRAKSVDAHTPVDFGTMRDRFRSTLQSRVLTMSLLSGFAAIALLLAAFGVYGLLSYAVSQRTRELAVRAALGAGRAQLVWLVVRSGARVVIAGATLGLIGALWMSRLLQGMLINVTPADPVTYASAGALLAAVSLAATLIPARRATRLDPMIALQGD